MADQTVPVERAFAITTDNSTNLSETTRAIYTGTGGDITVILAGDSAAVTFVDVPAGAIMPLRVARVLATGTVATGIVGLV
jgi:hypothetical protein